MSLDNSVKLCKCGCGTRVYFNSYVYPHGARKYTVNNNVLNELTSNSEYILGFIAGDGTYNPGKNKLIIALSNKDYNHLVKINNFFGSNAKIYEYTSSFATKMNRLVISSSKIIDAVISYGIVTHRIENDFLITNSYLANSRDFWRGMIDADGCIYIPKNEYGISPIGLSLCGNYNLLKQYVEFIFNNINISANILMCGSIYRVVVNGPKAAKLIKFLYKDADLYLDRKMELAKKVLELYTNV